MNKQDLELLDKVLDQSNKYKEALKEIRDNCLEFGERYCLDISNEALKDRLVTIDPRNAIQNGGGK